MLTLKIQTASIAIENNGDLLFSGEAIPEIILLSWGGAYEFDMRNKIEKSKCLWRLKDKDEIDLSIERGLDADEFIKNVYSDKTSAVGYLNYYNSHDILDFEIFLSNKSLKSFQYLIDKYIVNKNLFFEIHVNDFRELGSSDSDKLPTLKKFYNKQNGINVSDISFVLK